MIRPLLRLAVPRLLIGGVCAVALSGCISLLPKSKPAQLYRFSQAPAATEAAAARPNADRRSTAPNKAKVPGRVRRRPAS